MNLPKFVLIGLVSILVGCSTATKHASIDPGKSALLFPHGNYVHQVKLNLPNAPDPSKRVFEFRGAVKISADAIRIVVLSPIGTTVFKMTEDRATGKLTVENYVDQLNPYKDKLSEYYASLRVLLTTLRHPEGPGFSTDERGRPLSLDTDIAGKPTRFTFADYDEHQIPTTLHIASDQFNVDVKVLGYEL